MKRTILFLALGYLSAPSSAWATYCYNGGCFSGVDPTGRRPGASTAAAQEVLSHPQAYSPSTLALARQAIRDDGKPGTSDPVAVRCNKPGMSQNFAACVAAGHGVTAPSFTGAVAYTQRNTILWRGPDGKEQAYRDHLSGIPDDQVRVRWVACVVPQGTEIRETNGLIGYPYVQVGVNQGPCAGQRGWVDGRDVE